MYRIGGVELKRIERLFDGGKMFRYREKGECDRFEAAWGKHLGVKYVRMTTSGTSALYAALVGMKIGPGDAVIVPACTYMATALAVLAAGAIPIVADVDESITLCAKDLERRITPATRAVIPVHMWGLSCNMKAIMRVARKHKLLVLEDACQAVGGGYEGKALGSIGHAGAFSFNYYKNMSSGEGGAFATNNRTTYDRGSVAVDCCSYYWNPEEKRDDLQFAGHNLRATEVSGAILNGQLTRIDGMLLKMRSHKAGLIRAGEDAGLTSIKNNSLGHDCGTNLGFIFPTETEARAFSKRLRKERVGAFLPIDTGRHVYTRWDPILRKQGGHHPRMNPFNFPENRKLKVKYTMDMCSDSLDILSRSVLVPMHPDNTRSRVRKMGEGIRRAAT
ncbi:MAG: DegT/DnrJ/EryC1/StrS family aminotransferase [Candidatus Latescibacteria bacterium]|nr:DegT/DnrJ/EryC1/StrS family aminotransferase [Candidatus Latescibacterota bacterium]